MSVHFMLQDQEPKQDSAWLRPEYQSANSSSHVEVEGQGLIRGLGLAMLVGAAAWALIILAVRALI